MPVLQRFALLALSLLATCEAPPEMAPAASASTAPASDVAAALEAEILDLTNRERRRYSETAPVQAEPQLAEIARAHSEDLLRRGFFAHVNPDGRTPTDRVAGTHRRLVGLTGENIWMGSGYRQDSPRAVAAEVMRNWMGSPGHRENILRPEFSHLGVGVIWQDAEVRVTQLFATVFGYLDQPVPERVPRGAVLDLRTTSATPGRPGASLVDFWDTQREAATGGPSPVHQVRIEARPGTYRLRFYFPSGPRSYVICDGPDVTVE